MLTIKRWQEMDKRNPSDGLSWWQIRLEKEGHRLPPSSVIKKVFEQSIRAGIHLQTHKNVGHLIYVGMQIGLARKDREAFLIALEDRVKAA